jgi:hypothetical protein
MNYLYSLVRRFHLTTNQDDLERIFCKQVGEPGHGACGVCEQCRAPRFRCGHWKKWEPK